MSGTTTQRTLTTVLVTDIVGSTARAATLGDRAWANLLHRHNDAALAELRRYGGTLMRTTGDGVLATFTGPAAAIDAALELMEALREIDLDIRAGVHSGECEVEGNELAGIAVHVAARIAALADAGEVLVSTVVRDLAAGSGLHFAPKGTHSLKGVPGRWRLLRATRGDVAEADDRGGTKVAAPLPRVVLVDDHPLWRQSLAELIERRHVGRVVAQAGDGSEAIEAVRSSGPDVIVMDVALPVFSGIDATRKILAEHPRVKIVILSSSDERAQVLEGVRAGAAGYLLKTAGSDEILDAVRRVNRGEAVFPPALASLVLEQIRGTAGAGTVDAAEADDTPGDGLTTRERAVLELMAAGRSNQAICTQLHLSNRTVETHITAIFHKLGLAPAPDDHRRVLAVLAFLRARP